MTQIAEKIVLPSSLQENEPKNVQVVIMFSAV